MKKAIYLSFTSALFFALTSIHTFINKEEVIEEPQELVFSSEYTRDMYLILDYYMQDNEVDSLLWKMRNTD